ncbi:hypothetical protein [Segatella baroniae]|uniref:hypothetical protein n=1 Tax=Segatella baroniae TaxID=305719 RepID=UPI0003FA6F79|nr:hypothetical protein [Segatella baroniae]
MKMKLAALSMLLAAGLTQANAQINSKYQSDSRHEFRIGYSDGLTLSVASIWGIGLGDAVTGTTRTNETSTGVLGLGYRYHMNRFRLGLDLGFASVSSKYDYAKSKQKDIKETQLNFLVMPVAEMVYYKKGAFELYGSAAAGVDLTRTTEKGLTEAGKKNANTKAKTATDFAFQVNPIALRVGNDHIGGFLEAGLGYKGFVTAGVSLKF